MNTDRVQAGRGVDRDPNRWTSPRDRIKPRAAVVAARHSLAILIMVLGLAGIAHVAMTEADALSRVEFFAEVHDRSLPTPLSCGSLVHRNSYPAVYDEQRGHGDIAASSCDRKADRAAHFVQRPLNEGAVAMIVTALLIGVYIGICRYRPRIARAVLLCGCAISAGAMVWIYLGYSEIYYFDSSTMN